MFFATPPSIAAMILMLLVLGLVVMATVNTWDRATGVSALVLRGITSSLCVVFLLPCPRY